MNEVNAKLKACVASCTNVEAFLSVLYNEKAAGFQSAQPDNQRL